MTSFRRAFVLCFAVLLPAAIVAGCDKSSKYVPSGGGGITGTEHFNSIRFGGGHATDHLLNGQQRIGDGLVFWHLPSPPAPGSQNMTVRITFYLGPFGYPDDDNTVLPGEQPQMLPNYADGAETGRSASDYDPVLLNPVAGTNNQLWEVVFTRFPTTGRFLCTLKRGANVYARGQQRDSSYDSARRNLQARYDASRIIITTPGKP